MADQMVHTALTTQVVGDVDYAVFWHAMSKTDMASEMMKGLLDKLVVLSSGKKVKDPARDKTVKGKKGKYMTADSIEEETEMIINTIFFVSLYLQVDFSRPAIQDSVKSLEKSWSKHKDQNKDHDHSIDFKELFEIMKPDVGRNNLVVNMIHTCTDMDIVQWGECFSGHSNIYGSFLRESLTQGRYIDVMIKTLEGLLKLGQRMLSEMRLILICHLIRVILLNSTPSPLPSLEPLYNALSDFVAWPEPYSSIVRRTRAVIRQEMLFPGNLIRVTLTSALVGSTEDGSARIVPNHWVLGSSNGRGPLVRTLKDSFANFSVSSKQLKLLLMLDGVKVVGDVDMTRNYDGISDDKVNNLFKQFRQIVTTNHPGDDFETIAQSSRSLLEPIYRELCLSDIIGNGGGSTLLTNASSAAKRSSLTLGRDNLLRLVGSAASTGSIDMDYFLPRMTLFPLHEMDLNHRDDPVPPPPVDPPSQSNPDSQEVQAIRLVRLKATSQLRVVLNSVLESGVKTGKLCVAGDNEALHTVVVAYTTLMTEEPQLFEQQKIHFYPVPSSASTSCHLCEYIAMKDPIYRSSIYGPFRSVKSFVPALPSSTSAEPVVTDRFTNDDDVAVQATSHISPQLVLKREVQTYLWTARHVMLVPVFQCVCYPGAVSIPFCQHVEVGSRVEGMREKKDASELDKLSGVPLPNELTVRFHQMNPQLHKARQLVEITSPMSKLVVANVPTDDSTLNDATTPDLDLFGLCQTTKKQKKAYKGLSHSEMGPFQYHVADVEVRMNQGGKFNVLVDNRQYGPFSKIQISRFRQADDVPLSMPFATYVPISTV